MGVVLPFDGARGILKPGGPQTRNPAYFAVPNGLVGYWGFDADCFVSSTITTDLTNFANNGTLVGATKPSPSEGKIGQSLSFNITNAVTTSAQLPNGSPFSVSSWFKLSAISGSDYIMWAQNVGGKAIGFNVEASVSKVSYQSQNYSGTQGSYPAWTPDTNWHHLALVDSFANSASLVTSVQLYIDAVVLANTGSSAINPGASNFMIGGRAQLTAGFNGSIDDVRLYNRALDPWEVIQLYQTGLAGRRDAGVTLPQECEMPMLPLLAFQAGNRILMPREADDRQPTFSGMAFSSAGVGSFGASNTDWLLRARHRGRR